MNVEKDKPSPDRLKVKVQLAVTTAVYVTINTDSSKSVDEMRDQAMKLFDDAGGREYRNQFRSNTAIALISTPTVRVSDLSVLPHESGW